MSATTKIMCGECDQVYNLDTPLEVTAAHAKEHHGESSIVLKLCCGQCDQPLEFFATVKQYDEYVCERCHRYTKVKRRT